MPQPFQRDSRDRKTPPADAGGVSFLPIRLLLGAGRFGLLAALDAGAFIMFSLTELGKHARLCTRTLKASQCAVQRFIIFYADL